MRIGTHRFFNYVAPHKMEVDLRMVAGNNYYRTSYKSRILCIIGKYNAGC